MTGAIICLVIFIAWTWYDFNRWHDRAYKNSLKDLEDYKNRKKQKSEGEKR